MQAKTIGQLAVLSAGVIIKMEYMIGRQGSVGGEEKLLLSQALSVTINLQLNLFLRKDNKLGLIYIVKYFFSDVARPSI